MRFTAIGPSRSGCHEIPRKVAKRFLLLGGEDIQVWDTDYIIDAKSKKAVDYAVSELRLTNVEEAE